MTTLGFHDVEHPKIAQFAASIKNKYFKTKKTDNTNYN